jgi:hypothetical protein
VESSGILFAECAPKPMTVAPDAMFPHLIEASGVRAIYSPATRSVTISASVRFPPGDHGIEIRRGIVDPVDGGAPAFAIGARKAITVRSELTSSTTIEATFPLSGAPGKVIVYSAGPAGPLRQEVPVADGAGPVRSTRSTIPPEGKGAIARCGARLGVEATGWSRSFSYHEALGDAIEKLRAGLAGAEREAGFSATVVDMGIQVGGVRTHGGLYVTLRTT